MIDLLQSLLKSSYAKLLEKELEEVRRELAREIAENERLRAENRGLMNSLLGTAGHPPMNAPQMSNVTPHLLRRRSLHQMQARMEKNSVRALRNRVEVAANTENGDGGSAQPEAEKAS